MSSSYIHLLTLSLAFGVLSALLPGLADAQATTTIQGRVVNGTMEDPLPANLTVTLHIEKGLEDRDILMEEVDHNGMFQFLDVILDENFRYIATTRYQEVLYAVELESSKLTMPIQLMVYENTSSTEETYVTNAILMITGAFPDSKMLEVLEIIGLENRGDRAFVPNTAEPAKMNFLRFPLPATYANLDVHSNLQGGQVIPVDKGFGFTAPVPPGTYQIMFTYHILYDGSQIDFTRSLRLGAINVRILMPEELGKIRAPVFQVLAPVMMNGTNYRLLQAQELPKGTTVTIDIYDLPETSWWRRWDEVLSEGWFFRIAIPVAVALALTAILLTALRRGRR